MNSLSRRNFFAISGLVPALVASHATRKILSAPTDTNPSTAPMEKKKIPIGLELYSVRNELSRDLPNTLRTVAKMGYEAVEFYSPYFSWTIPYAKDVRTLMEDVGLRSYSTHNGAGSFAPGDGIAKAIELNQILGTKHIIMASAGNVKGTDGWKKLCEQLSTAVEQLKPHGLGAGYHNHQAEWKTVDGGERIMDIIAANTPKEFVLQLDVGTCMEAGADPVAWINGHPGRIKSIHVKDWAPAEEGKDKGYRVLFTEGATPWKALLAAAESTGGVEYYLMEQEGSRLGEFETAKRCLELWRNFKRG